MNRNRRLPFATRVFSMIIIALTACEDHPLDPSDRKAGEQVEQAGFIEFPSQVVLGRFLPKEARIEAYNKSGELAGTFSADLRIRILGEWGQDLDTISAQMINGVADLSDVRVMWATARLRFRAEVNDLEVDTPEIPVEAPASFSVTFSQCGRSIVLGDTIQMPLWSASLDAEEILKAIGSYRVAPEESIELTPNGMIARKVGLAKLYVQVLGRVDSMNLAVNPPQSDLVLERPDGGSELSAEPGKLTQFSLRPSTDLLERLKGGVISLRLPRTFAVEEIDGTGEGRCAGFTRYGTGETRFLLFAHQTGVSATGCSFGIRVPPGQGTGSFVMELKLNQAVAEGGKALEIHGHTELIPLVVEVPG